MPSPASATATEPKDRDGLLAAVSLLVALGSVALLAFAPSLTGAPPQLAKVVGKITVASSDLKRRPARTLGWTSLPRGSDVREQDALYVPPGVEARLTFNDGSVLELDERTLVVVEVPRPGRKQSVSLSKGSLATRAGAGGFDVVTPQGTAELAAQGEAKVLAKEGSTEVDVEEGVAMLSGKTLKEGERAAASAKGVEALAPWPVLLKSPKSNERRFFKGTPPPMVLAWSGSLLEHATVQLARDRSFAFLIHEEPGAAEQWTFSGDTGVFWWRVVDDAGQPLSESRRFSLLEDVPPQLATPAQGEVVLSNADSPAFFSWSQVRGVSRYRLEISERKDFATPAFSRDVDAPQVKVALELPEGVWLWRVRPVDDQRGEATPSPPKAFRLIHKPVLDAPELLNPVIEVEDEPQQ